MNRKATIIAVMLSGMIMLALAATGENGYQVRSIAEARAMEGGAWVTVQGNIAEKIADDHYLMVDDTGQIELKIGRDEWGQYSYDPDKKAQVYGEINRSGKDVMIEVKKVFYLN